MFAAHGTVSAWLILKGADVLSISNHSGRLTTQTARSNEIRKRLHRPL
jgi:hypothetical protein